MQHSAGQARDGYAAGFADCLGLAQHLADLMRAGGVQPRSASEAADLIVGVLELASGIAQPVRDETADPRLAALFRRP
jgi:hypothetical protein